MTCEKGLQPHCSLQPKNTGTILLLGTETRDNSEINCVGTRRLVRVQTGNRLERKQIYSYRKTCQKFHSEIRVCNWIALTMKLIAGTRAQ